jgi:S1-C subfamily serine protease
LFISSKCFVDVLFATWKNLPLSILHTGHGVLWFTEIRLQLPASTMALIRIGALIYLVGGACAFAQNPAAGTSGISNLSVSELKRLLTERGVDFRDCLEKRDLVERLQQSGPAPKATEKQQLYTPEENLFVQTFKRVAPSVAYITTTTTRRPRQFSLQGDESPAGAGSGFLWDRHGHVVTNCHVVMSSGSVAKNVKVKLQGMPLAYDAIVVGVEPEKDLAVLKIPAKSLPQQIDVGTSDDLQVGQKVLAIGNPFGLDNTLTTGVVSAIGRDVNGFGGRKIKGCVQTDGK